MGRLVFFVATLLTIGSTVRAEDRTTYIDWIHSTWKEKAERGMKGLAEEGPDAFGDVAALLEARELFVRRRAMTLLVGYAERMESVEPFAPLLLNSLREKDKKLAAGAAKVLARAGPKTFAKLYKLLHSNDEVLATLAATSFAGSGARAVPYLNQRLAGKSRKRVIRALETLQLIGTGAAGARAAAEPHLADSRLDVRMAAIRSVTAIDPDAKRAVAVLLAALDDPELACVLLACELLARHPEQAASALAAQLEKPASLRRDKALHAFSGLGVEAAPALAELLDSKNAAARVDALRLLVEIGATKRAKARAVQLLHEGSADERVAAARYISLCSDDEKLIANEFPKLLADKQKAIGDWAWYRLRYQRTKDLKDRELSEPEVVAIHGGETARIEPILSRAQDPDFERALPALRAAAIFVRAYVPGSPKLRASRFAALPTNVRECCENAWKWLETNQRPDGSWQAGFGGGQVGITALALLAFSGGGHTDESGPYARTIRRAIGALLARRNKQGCFGPIEHRLTTLQHAMATAALLDAQLVGSCPYAHEATAQSLRILMNMQRKAGAWSYTKVEVADMYHTFWAAYAARLGSLAGQIPIGEYRKNVIRYVDGMTDPEFGVTGYSAPGGNPSRPVGLEDSFPPEKSQSMTAAGLWIRLLLHDPAGDARKSKIAKLGFRLLVDIPPRWDEAGGGIDMAYWHFGANAIAMAAVEDPKNHAYRKLRKDWLNPLVALLLEQQQANGTWRAIGAWGGDGGETMTAALGLLSLLAPVQFSSDFHLWPAVERTGAHADARALLEKASKSDDPRRAFAAAVALR